MCQMCQGKFVWQSLASLSYMLRQKSLASLSLVIRAVKFLNFASPSVHSPAQLGLHTRLHVAPSCSPASSPPPLCPSRLYIWLAALGPDLAPASTTSDRARRRRRPLALEPAMWTPVVGFARALWGARCGNQGGPRRSRAPRRGRKRGRGRRGEFTGDEREREGVRWGGVESRR
jgi:hypothetical protein